MPEDGGESGADFDALPEGAIRDKLHRNDDGNEPFAEIEKEAEDASLFSESAEDIGRADVSRAMLADVDPS